MFETILANATRLCEASYGTLWLCEGDAIRAVALHGAVPDAYAAEIGFLGAASASEFANRAKVLRGRPTRPGLCGGKEHHLRVPLGRWQI